MRSKIIGAAVAAIALLATTYSTQAADIPRPIYKGVRSVVAYYNWTGFYAGLNAGYGWGSSTWTVLPGIDMDPSGFVGGLTLGYNYQIGSIVWGLEGDINFSNVKGDVTCAVVLTCETSNSYLITFRGRLGYAFDRWLPYLTAGGAYGDIKADVSAGGLAASASESRLGWTAGFGLEYAFAGNWTAKIEYLYVDLGSFDTGPSPIINDVSFNENIVRIGLNYKFSGPVFTRY
jgi:outer membrane immunogenic protein